MGHANDDMAWLADTSAGSFLDYPDLRTDQQRVRRHSIPRSLRSSNCTEYSMRTGSTQPDLDCMFDDYNDRDSWRNTLTFENARHSQAEPPEWLVDLSTQPSETEEKQLFASPRSTQARPPSIPPRLPSPRAYREIFTLPSSSIANPQYQIFPKQLLDRKEERKTDKPPMLPLRRTPSLPTPQSPYLTLLPEMSKPHKPSKIQDNAPVRPPKATQECLQPKLPPKPTQKCLQRKMPQNATHECLQPKLPPKPTQECLQPLLPPKPTQTNNQPILPPKPTQMHNQPMLPPKPGQSLQQLIPSTSSQENLQPRIPPKPSQQHQLPSQQHQLLPQSLPQVPLAIFPQTSTQTPEVPPSDDETSSSSSPREWIPYQHSSSRSSDHSERRPHFLIRRRNLIIASFVSLLLSLASIALLILILDNPFTYRWQDRTFQEGAFSACIKCLQLMQNIEDVVSVPEFNQLFNEERDGDIYCCAKTGSQMSALIKLILRQQEYKPSFQPQTGKPHVHTPGAHKYLTTLSEKSQVFGNVMTINTADMSNQYINNVLVRNNSLLIKVGGWYYVYSNIFYQAQCKQLQPHTPKTFEYTVLAMSKRNPAKSGNLVKSAHTCCHNCAKDRKSVFMGGIFELLEDDQIFSTVTNINAVDGMEKPFIGLVMLGQ